MDIQSDLKGRVCGSTLTNVIMLVDRMTECAKFLENLKLYQMWQKNHFMILIGCSPILAKRVLRRVFWILQDKGGDQNVKPKGYKPGPKPEEFESMRADCKRRKEALDYPMYVPKDGMKKTNTISKKKSAGGSLDVVIFSFN